MQYQYFYYLCCNVVLRVTFRDTSLLLTKFFKTLYGWCYTFHCVIFQENPDFFPFDYGSADKIFSHVFSVTQCAYIWRLASEAASVYEHSPTLVWNCRYWRGDCTLHSSTEVRTSNACVECGHASLHFWLRSASYFRIMVLSFIGVQNAQCSNLIFGH